MAEVFAYVGNGASEVEALVAQTGQTPDALEDLSIHVAATGLVHLRDTRVQCREQRTIVREPRISGRREHIPRSSGQTIRPISGEIVADAVWPAIIAPGDSDRLRALLTELMMHDPRKSAPRP